MEYEILDAFEDLRYEEKIDDEGLKLLLKDTVRYSKVLEWICIEIKGTSNLEESVTRVEKDEDLKAFCMELSSLLRELGCPYNLVMNGNINERYDSIDTRKLILNFLLGELQAARIAYINNPKQLKVELAESNTARLLREMMQALGIQKPPVNIPMTALLTKINDRLNEIQKRMSPKLKDKPIFVGELSEKQWVQLGQLDKQFQNEYHMRREMLLKRLDVTIQSFHWSDRLRSKKDEINRIFREKRAKMEASPSVILSDILAARTDLAIMEKTSSASVRKNTKSSVNAVIIGRVPDRGGRPNEVQPPPPEMPPWQQRQGGAPGQGGWSQAPQTQSNYGPGRGPRGGGQQRSSSDTPQWQQRQGGGAPGHGQGGWSQPPQAQSNYGPGRGARGGGHRPKVQGGWSNQQDQHQQGGYYQQGQQGGYHQGQQGGYHQGQQGGYHQRY